MIKKMISWLTSGFSGTLFDRSIELQEKQLEAACKKLWVAVHGAEYEIRQLVRDEQKEGGANQAMLGRLNKHLGLGSGWEM